MSHSTLLFAHAYTWGKKTCNSLRNSLILSGREAMLLFLTTRHCCNLCCFKANLQRDLTCPDEEHSQEDVLNSQAKVVSVQKMTAVSVSMILQNGTHRILTYQRITRIGPLNLKVSKFSHSIFIRRLRVESLSFLVATGKTLLNGLTNWWSLALKMKHVQNMNAQIPLVSKIIDELIMNITAVN